MAKRLFITVFKHYLFWIALFLTARIIFLAWNSEELTNIPMSEIFLSFVVALYLDTAMACYLLVIPFLFSLLSLGLRKPSLLKINNYIHLVLLVCFFLLTLSELSIYDEWHKKLDYKALWFFGNPAEVFHTASWSQILSGFLGTAVLAGISYWFYKKYIAEKVVPERSRHWSILAYALSVPCLLIIGIRGGFQTIPIQLSDAYFSKHDVVNLATVNSVFNLASSCIENANAGAPYRFVSAEEANKVFSELHFTPKDTTVMLLNTTRPNIVLVVLEGWSADMVESCGGFENVTPHFDEMTSQGFLFTNCYASGSLSDQGMAAVFSGFPAQPRTSIITQPTKYERLPCINQKLEEAGYATSFMFGGQLSYGNIRSYMYYNGFNKIIEGKDFPDEIPQGKLGVHDEFLFTRQLQELKNEKQPFFASMFTLSTHGPYDFPMTKDLGWGGKEQEYVNSVHYADNCIRNFIEAAKKEPWYSNTLFVFVSDHSHNTPKNYAFNAPAYRRIPMLFFGEALKTEFRGVKYESSASQTDLASTLLHQVNLDAGAFRYSKNLMNPYAKRFAYFAFEEGFGWVEEFQYTVWSVNQGTERAQVNNPGESARLLHNGQAYLQTLMDEYWAY